MSMQPIFEKLEENHWRIHPQIQKSVKSKGEEKEGFQFFGIRCDWFPLDLLIQKIVEFRKGWIQIDPRSQKIKPQALEKKEGITQYLQDFKEKLEELYPFDFGRMFSYTHPVFRISDLYKWQRTHQKTHLDQNPPLEVQQKHSEKISPNTFLWALFSPEDLGLSFISHAHIDHTPFTANHAVIMVYPSNYAEQHQERSSTAQHSQNPNQIHRGNKWYPFPVLCSGMTEILLEMRFGCRVVNGFKHLSHPSTPIGKTYQKWLNQYRNFYMRKNGLNQTHQLRLKYIFEIRQWHDWLIWMVPNGHVMGSTALCVISQKTAIKMCKDHAINGKKILPFADIIYFGECNPYRRVHTLPLPNCWTKMGLFEGLFIDPRLNFPPVSKEIQRCVTWIKKEITNHPIILLAHDLGKIQWIISLLNHEGKKTHEDNHDQIPFVAAKPFVQLMKFFQIQGLPMGKIWTKSQAHKKGYYKKHNFILINHPSEREARVTQKLIHKRKAVMAEITGWTLDPEYRTKYPADAYFTISDHAVYSDLKNYLDSSRIQAVQVQSPNNYFKYKRWKEASYLHKKRTISDK